MFGYTKWFSYEANFIPLIAFLFHFAKIKLTLQALQNYASFKFLIYTKGIFDDKLRPLLQGRKAAG